MKKWYLSLLGIMLGVLVLFGFISLVDKDPATSVTERRAEKPKFSWSALWDGS